MPPVIDVYPEKKYNRCWKYVGKLKIGIGGYESDLEKFPTVNCVNVDPTICQGFNRNFWNCLIDVSGKGYRGWPNDISDQLKTFFKFNDMLDDSCSWLVLDEILNFNWNIHTFVKNCDIKPEYTYLFPEKLSYFPYENFPDKWIQEYNEQWKNSNRKFKRGLWGQAHLLSKIRAMSHEPSFRVQWIQTYAEECIDLLDVIPELCKYGKNDKVRILYTMG